METERVLNLFGAVALAISDRLNRAMTDVAGLGGEAAAAIVTLGTRPRRSIEALRRTLGLSHSGTVRLVDRLEAEAWVRRMKPDRGREVLLDLTGAGGELYCELLAARRRVLARALSDMPDAERAHLGRALARVLGGLPSDRDDAWNICRLCEHGVCEGAACPVGSAVD